jgi:hypothetical protein
LRHVARVKTRKLVAIGSSAALIAACGVLFWPRVVVAARMVGMRFGSSKSVADRLDEYGPAVEERLAKQFEAAGVAWPPQTVLLVAFKDERRLELLASRSADVAEDPDATRDFGPTAREPGSRDPTRWHRVASWPILAASGTLGPKLREGDRQVPEGLYAIESLNPMSRFHLALRVGYPNGFDRARAIEDGRTDLGGDIMVHGSSVSIGCLAMGDEVAEDLFVVTTLAGVENASILIAPCDLRVRTDVAPPSGSPSWTRAAWDEIRSRLDRLPPQ